MKKRELAPPATNPSYADVEAVAAADGGLCLVVGGTRVAGVEPSLHLPNIQYRWNVRVDDLRQALVKRRKS